MKNMKLIKAILVIMLTLSLLLVTTKIFAADGDEEFSLLEVTTNTTNSTNTTNTTNTFTNTTNTTNSTNTVNNTESLKSSYNNTNLPYTGVVESSTTVLLIVVFAISAVYAFKKISDYKGL